MTDYNRFISECSLAKILAMMIYLMKYVLVYKAIKYLMYKKSGSADFSVLPPFFLMRHRGFEPRTT